MCDSKVLVGLPGSGGFFSPSYNTHKPATHWKVTKKGTLRVFCGGEEVGRYKPERWATVRKERSDSE